MIDFFDSKVYYDPKTGKESFILSSVVCSLLPRKVHLDHVLEVLPGGCDKQHSATGALQRKGTIEVHNPFFRCFLAGESRFLNLFVLRWCPFSYDSAKALL